MRNPFRMFPRADDRQYVPSFEEAMRDAMRQIIDRLEAMEIALDRIEAKLEKRP